VKVIEQRDISYHVNVLHLLYLTCLAFPHYLLITFSLSAGQEMPQNNLSHQAKEEVNSHKSLGTNVSGPQTIMYILLRK
jgi:hypothetical protein